MPDNMNHPEEAPNGAEEIQTDQESQRKGITRRNFILGGLSVLGLAALGEGARRTLNKGSDEVATDPTLEPATPPPTFTPEPTPTPEPVREYPEFMPDAKRNIYGDTSLATDSEYPDRKECPDPNAIYKTTACSSMNELYLREETFEIEAENGQKEEKTVPELLNEGNEKIMAIAWMRLSRGLSIEEIANNYNDLFAEYQDLKLKGLDVSFNIYGFNEQKDYSNPAVLTIDPSYKVEYVYVPLPNKYTNIELQSSFKAGFVANTVNKKLYIVIYDFAAGGVGNDNVAQAIPSEYHVSSAIAWAGVLLSDKDAQMNQKVTNHKSLAPIRLEIEKSFIPYKTDTLWKGIVIAR